MKVKATLAIAALAASIGSVSACGSSTSKAGASTPPTPVSVSTSTPAAPSSPATPTSADSSASSSAPSQAAPLKDVPDSALLAVSDLVSTPRGKWNPEGSSKPIAADEMIDPDNCDPVTRPQQEDPKYPRNPAWTGMRSVVWSSSDSMAQVDESVVTYSSVSAAAADFAKHRNFVLACGDKFQWTDMPAKQTVSKVSLPQVTDAYAIRVAMYSPDQPASAAGSQGYVYMSVILRGNVLAFVTESDTGPTTAKLNDPGSSAAQHDTQVAATKLSAAFGAK